MTWDKETLATRLPEMIESMWLELEVELGGFTLAIVDGAREREQSALPRVATMRWRIERALELQAELPRLAFDVVPQEVVDRFGEDAAAAWWRIEERRRADADMREATVTACATDGAIATGADLLRMRQDLRDAGAHISWLAPHRGPIRAIQPSDWTPARAASMGSPPASPQCAAAAPGSSHRCHLPDGHGGHHRTTIGDVGPFGHFDRWFCWIRTEEEEEAWRRSVESGACS